MDNVAVLGFEAEVLVPEVPERADEQCSGAKQDEGDSSLHDHENFFCPEPANSGGTVRATQGINRVSAGGHHCRGDAEQYTGYERDGKSEAEHSE